MEILKNRTICWNWSRIKRTLTLPEMGKPGLFLIAIPIIASAIGILNTIIKTIIDLFNFLLGTSISYDLSIPPSWVFFFLAWSLVGAAAFIYSVACPRKFKGVASSEEWISKRSVTSEDIKSSNDRLALARQTTEANINYWLNTYRWLSEKPEELRRKIASVFGEHILEAQARQTLTESSLTRDDILHEYKNLNQLRPKARLLCSFALISAWVIFLLLGIAKMFALLKIAFAY